jgi:hypothetical protein
MALGNRLAAAALFAAGLFAPAASAELLFDFEEHTVTAFVNPGPGALTSLASERDGLTLTIVRSSGLGFDVGFAAPGSFAPGWGFKTLDPFAFQTGDDFFVGTFSEGVAAVTLEAADFLEDQDFLTLEGFAGPGATGDLVDDAIEMWSSLSTAPDFETVTVQADLRAIRSIRFRGGSAGFPNSMFVDNVSVTPLPEPGAAALAAAVAAMLARAAHSRRRRP